MAHFKSAHNVLIKHQQWDDADFNTAQNLVKKFEGGYSNDPRDAGNWTSGKINEGQLIGTNFGISAPTLVAEMKRLGGAFPTANLMKNLAYASAVAIYKRNYWNPIKGDDIKNQTTANILYDTNVNMGIGKVNKYIKDSLNISKYDVDKINSANQSNLANTILAKRKADYEKIGGYALDSWLKRLDTLKEGVKANPIKTVIAVLLISGIIVGSIMYFKKQ